MLGILFRSGIPLSRKETIMGSKDLEEKIRDNFSELSSGINSVVILTSHDNQRFINDFYTPNQNRKDLFLHEMVADIIHAKIGLNNTNSVKDTFSWDKYENNANWQPNDHNKKQNRKIVDYFEQMRSKHQQFLPSTDSDYIEDENKLLIKYNMFYTKMQIIKGRLKHFEKEKLIDSYVLIGNFNDQLGYYADSDDSDCPNMIQGWANNLSQTQGFSLQLLAHMVDGWNCDELVLLSDKINQQLSKQDSEASLCLRKGLLYKTPKIGNTFTAHELAEVNEDIEFQRIADDLKLINPRSYFMFIETKSAYYLSLPADISNASLITLLYLTYTRFLKSRDVNGTDGAIDLTQATENTKLALNSVEASPLTKADRKNLLSNYGRRTRRYTQAGRNLASYKTIDIAKELNCNSDVFNFIIVYSMRNRDEHVRYSDTIRKLYDDKDMAGVIIQICYMIGSIMGSQYDKIWHNFDNIYTAIQAKNLDQIREFLEH